MSAGIGLAAFPTVTAIHSINGITVCTRSSEPRAAISSASTQHKGLTVTEVHNWPDDGDRAADAPIGTGSAVTAAAALDLMHDHDERGSEHKRPAVATPRLNLRAVLAGSGFNVANDENLGRRLQRDRGTVIAGHDAANQGAEDHNIATRDDVKVGVASNVFADPDDVLIRDNPARVPACRVLE